MHLTGLCRLGRDVEIRVTPDGTAVGNLALAFNFGRKGSDGNRPTQWIDASLWGERVEKLEPYLLKGTQLSVILSDPHVETYEKKDGGMGVKMVARVDSLEFASSPKEGGEQRSSKPRQRAPEPKPKSDDYAKATGKDARKTGFEDLDDDIPF